MGGAVVGFRPAWVCLGTNGSSGGAIIGEFNPSRTGSWDVFEEEMVAIDHIDGVHDLTFVGEDANWIMEMKSFELSEIIGSETYVSETYMMSPTVSPKAMPTSVITCVDSPL